MEPMEPPLDPPLRREQPKSFDNFCGPFPIHVRDVLANFPETTRSLVPSPNTSPARIAKCLGWERDNRPTWRRKMEDGSRSPGPISMRAVPSVNPGAAGDGGMGRLDHLRQGWRAFTRGTIHSSIFTLLTTCIGAGTLSLPFAFAKGSILIASVIFLGVMLISVIVGFMLFSGKRYCSELFPKMEVWGYEDLAQAAFGAVGKVSWGGGRRSTEPVCRQEPIIPLKLPIILCRISQKYSQKSADNSQKCSWNRVIYSR